MNEEISSGIEAPVASTTNEAPAVPQTPTPIELKDDSLVSIPGVNKPVKFGEHYRGLQGQFTRASQEKAELSRQVKQIQDQLRERDSRLEQISRGQVKDQRSSLSDSLRNEPYITGEAAAKLVENIYNEFNSVGGALDQRDRLIYGMAQQLAELKNTVGQLNGRSAQGDFESKISRFVEEGGLPKRAIQRAKELYMAYEGDDLDSEFPRILAEWWEDVQGLTVEQRKVQQEAARKRPFLPGKGGAGSAPRGLDQLTKMNPAEVADALWANMHTGDET